MECAGLLRQLYTLDLEIWGMEKCIAEDMPQKEGYCRQANDVFSQIKTMVNAWPRDADFGWNREEKTIIEEIRHAVNCYRAQRYDASPRSKTMPRNTCQTDGTSRSTRARIEESINWQWVMTIPTCSMRSTKGLSVIH